MKLNFINKRCWARMFIIAPAFAVIGFGLTAADYNASLVVAITACGLVACALLSEIVADSPTLRLTAVSVASVLPLLTAISLCRYWGVNRYLALTGVLCAYSLVVFLGWRGRPRCLMTAFVWSAGICMGFAGFMITETMCPHAMGTARDILWLVSCQWI